LPTYFTRFNIVNGKFGKLIQEDFNEDDEEGYTPDETNNISMAKPLRKKMTREIGRH
jgi:hypothetical protein